MEDREDDEEDYEEAADDDDDDDDDYAAPFAEDPWARAGSSKLRDHLEQRRAAHDQLVDAVRRYGTVVVAVAVLLPAQLVLVAMVGVGFVYICMRHVRFRGGTGPSPTF